jgi:hypothetical protein
MDAFFDSSALVLVFYGGRTRYEASLKRRELSSSMLDNSRGSTTAPSSTERLSA